MTLTEYLGTAQAIEDVRALLEDLPKQERRNGIPKSAGQGTILVLSLDTKAMLHSHADGAWQKVVLSSERADGLGWVYLGLCYYREPAPGHYIISDCGEAVSGIMRRTGGDYDRATNAVMDLAMELTSTGPYVFVGMPSLSVAIVHQNHLAPALVSVLSAVAKCAEVK